MKRSVAILSLLLALLLPVQGWTGVSTTTTSSLGGATTGNGTSGAVTEPAGAASGDMLLACTLIDGAGSGLTRPSGWTNIFNGTSLETQLDYDFSYISRTGSAPSLTWTWTGNVYYEVHILKITTDDAGTVTLDANSAAVNSQFSGAADPPAVTVVGANSLVAACIANWSGSAAGGWGAPTNYTVRSTNTNGLDGVIIARTALVGTGVEDPGTLTNVSDTGPNTVSFSISFNETGGGGGGPTPPPIGTLGLMGVGR